MPIDLSRETGQLRIAFNDLLAGLPEEEQTASRSLLERCGIGHSKEPSWNARFKPLTLLYPLLESEAFPALDGDLCRRLTLGHECLIIYGFLDDRLRDGQMEFGEAEIAFLNRLAREAVVRLLPEGAEGVPADLDEAVRVAMETYRDAQEVEYAPADRGFDPGADEVRRILGARALYGFISTLALGRLAEADPETMQKLRDAFDWLATALQWVDDLEDIDEDLQLGEENLVVRLALAGGFDAKAEWKNGMDLPVILLELAARGILHQSADHAVACFEASSALHRELGGLQLAELLQERVSKLSKLTGTR